MNMIINDKFVRITLNYNLVCSVINIEMCHQLVLIKKLICTLIL